MVTVEQSPGDGRVWRDPAALLVALGVTLFGVALAWHGREIVEIGAVVGPGAALVVDGTPALALVYVGYRVDGSDLPTPNRQTVVVWAALGVVAGAGVIALTFLVRELEGRTIAEPVFPLLTAANLGGVAGAIAGYRDAQARADAHRAETANEALVFLNGLIRHDLRNDLVAIRSAAELIGGDDDVSGEDHVGTIRAKADESLARIDTTRAVAETLVGDADTEEVDLADVVGDVVDDLDESVAGSVTAETPDAARVRANAGVRSVVDNLVENAIEHNDRPVGEQRVRVTVESSDAVVGLTVADNGPGLSEERAAWVSSDRAEPPGDGEGGLAIVRRLVGEYGGDLQVSDRDPQGTAFTVEFERADAV